jgi:hypothetical protein
VSKPRSKQVLPSVSAASKPRKDTATSGEKVSSTYSPQHEKMNSSTNSSINVRNSSPTKRPNPASSGRPSAPSLDHENLGRKHIVKAKTSNKTMEARRSLAGQAFRSLSHMNNTRKLTRNEPRPDISALQLMTVTELDNLVPSETAHLLPAGPQAVHDDGTSLFIPETLDDSFFDTSGTVNADMAPKSPRGLPPSAPRLQVTAQEPPSAARIRGNDGREWYRGDIVCTLSSGRPIGKVKLVGSPWHPIGDQLVSLREGNDLKIDFLKNNTFNRYEYDKYHARVRIVLLS